MDLNRRTDYLGRVQSVSVGGRKRTLTRLWPRLSRGGNEKGSVTLVSLLVGLKRVQSLSESYLERSKILKKLIEIPSVYNEHEDKQLYEEEKKKASRKNILKLKLVEYLIKDLKEHDDYQIYQIELLLKVMVDVHLAIQFNKESRVVLSRIEGCVDFMLDKLKIEGHLSKLNVRSIFQIIQQKKYWQLKDDCLGLVEKVYELCKNQGICLLYIMESLNGDYEYLSESANVLQKLLVSCKSEGGSSKVVNLLIERCCMLIAECDPRRNDTKIALEMCLVSLVSANGDELLPAIAAQSTRTSIGKYRSDIADFLYYFCRDKEACGLADMIGPLILMLDDRDPDVVIRAYQIFTQILSPTISCLYQFHSTDNFISEAARIKIESQPSCRPDSMDIIKSEIKHITLLMLICYIRHATYPKTLEALLIFNCAVIIEVRDPFILSRLVSSLLNLQEAALSILPMRSMRQSFMQWCVTHLFLLVADVYSISSLKDYVFEVINQRKAQAPYLLYPLSPSVEDFIPLTCLLEKQQVSTIIENWNELVEPTRTLHGNTPSSSLSYLSDWRDFDKDL